MMWNKSRENGFGLIEAMVSIALLSVVIYFGMGAVKDQKKSRADRSKQSIQRYIAIQVVEHITANLHLYPPLVLSSSGLPFSIGNKKIYYVGCLDKDGVLIGGTSYKYRELRLLMLPLGGSAPTFPSFCSTDAVMKNKYHYEVAFEWLAPVTLNKIQITLTTRYSEKNKSLSSRKYVIFAK